VVQKLFSSVRRGVERLEDGYPVMIRRCGYRLYRALMVHAAKRSQLHVPLSELGIRSGHPTTGGQGQTAYRKCRLIEETLPDEAMSALDIGCYNGFIALRLATKGVFTVGLDADRDLVALGQLAAIAGKVDRVAFCCMTVDPENVQGLPEVDVTLLMSVIHHWIAAYGWSAATGMLSTVWTKTRRCLYFEMPNPCENSKLAALLSRMGRTEPECREFIRRFLASLESSEVRYLDYLVSDFRGGEERRHLFMATRTGGRLG
jgi:SAM-dependent methyltransferase